MMDKELVASFLDEAVDTLAQWERACLDLENEESDDAYNSLFRAAHNLKGTSKAVGLNAFGTLVHQIEDVITLVINKDVPLSGDIVALLLDAQVFLTDWIGLLRTNPQAVPSAKTLETRILAVGEYGSFGEEASELPVLHELTAQSGNEDLDKLFEQALDAYDSNTKESCWTGGESSPIVPPIIVEQVDTESAATSTYQGAERKKTTSESTLAVAKQSAGSSKTSTNTAIDHKSKSDSKMAKAPEETVRVAAHKLDELIQLIGELTIHQSIIFQGQRSGNLQQKFIQNAIMLSHKIIKDLHGTALSLRMQPVQSLFQRLERVAKDVARAQSKKIDVVLEGTDVELDKSVIEQIADPLVHIIRNAVDHGVETVDARIASEKSPSARVKVSAMQDASIVSIVVSDDGRGLSRAKVLSKAIEKGLLKESDVLSEKEIQNLIFLPGFSTADKVTDISGRGVGMDVVLRAVQDLQGSIDVTSIEGQGTTFTVALPTTMSIIDGLVVRINDLRYVVSMHELTEIIDLSNYTVEHSGASGTMISLRGGVIPLEALKKYIQVEKADKQGKHNTFAGVPALVVKHGSNLIAFQIDGVLGQQSVVVRPLNEQMSSIGGFSGSTVLGDGEPGMILNLSEIARQYFARSQGQEQYR